ncbi:MAG: hypothetical protein KTR25_10210 [Myxococcales bacterium]|nr:hypothetical protein [Myxococcales bacterium]
MYKSRQGTKRLMAPAFLVSAFAITSQLGCGGAEAPPPNDDAVVDPGIQCPPGQVYNQAIQACEDIPDACSNVDPCSPLPNGSTTGQKQAIGANQCVCVATGCVDGYQLQTGVCIQDVQCPDGFAQEGGICVPVTDVSCADAPNSPLCIPPLCVEVPDFAALPPGPDGEAWDAQSFEDAGKCLALQPPPVESCTNNCHNGIEDPHPWFTGPDLTCTGCHGGDPDATDRVAAHVSIPQQWQVGSTQVGRPNLRYYWNYYTLAGAENFQGGLEWLRFRNPGDLRVANATCGKGAGCHSDRVANVRRSVMSTESGLTGVSLARNGIARDILRGGANNDLPIYKYDTTSGISYNGQPVQALAYDPNMAGSVQQLTSFNIQNRQNANYNQLEILKGVYDKQCGDCHLNNAGANQRYADFRSSGCSACHVNYALDGLSKSSDQVISKTEPTYPNAYAQIANFDVNDLQNLNGQWLGPERAHPTTHRMTRQMPAQRCGVCHVGSNRTDWQFRGYQIDPNRTVATAVAGGFLNANQFQFTDEIDNNQNPFALYHGQTQDQVLKVVDWNNDGLDDIPADIHYQAGMECMDCHTTGEMHNELKVVQVAQVSDWNDPSQVKDMSGALWSHMDQSTEVECVHCHGNLEYRALSNAIDNRNPVKNLVVCPEPGEQVQGYTPPAECGNLGSGRFVRSKFTGNYHRVAQTYDTVQQGVQGNGLNASMMHGRVGGNGLVDGVGPCINGDPNQCVVDQADANSAQIQQGFSHLGAPATSAVDQHAGGLECYACHATWGNNCQGCHLRLADNDGNGAIFDFARSTGELTLGQVTEADFTGISPLDVQFGINSEGKVAQFLPETKQFVAHTTVDNQQFFGTQVIVNNDANIQYNVYRNRDGLGLRQFATENVGFPPNIDGPNFIQDAQQDENAGQGFQQFAPHSTQRSHPLMDCTNCHVDVNASNTAAIQARYAANPTGFANLSDYLNVLQNTGITRNNSNETYAVNAAAGFLFDANTDPAGFSVVTQADYCVNEATAFPLCYSNHPFKENALLNATTIRPVPDNVPVAGPFTQPLMNQMFNVVKVNNINVQYRQGGR